jgi:hypothetical protein
LWKKRAIVGVVGGRVGAGLNSGAALRRHFCNAQPRFDAFHFE